MHDLQLEVFGEFLAVCQDFLEVYDQSHVLVKLIMEELEDLEDVLADRHLFSLVVKHCKDVLLDLALLPAVLIGSQRHQGEPNGSDLFDLHELLLGRHVEPSLLLYRVVEVSADQSLVDLGLTRLFDPRKRKHLIVFLDDFLVVEMLVHDVGDAIAEVDEVADDDQLQHMLVELLVEELFLVCPVQDQDSGLLEVHSIVVLAIVLEKLIDQVFLVQEGPMLMQGHIAFHHSDVIEHQLGFTVGLDVQFLDQGKEAH